VAGFFCAYCGRPARDGEKNVIPQFKIETVRRLLAEEVLSYRAIALRTGVSRSSVQKIANHQMPDRPPTPVVMEVLLPTGPLVRCAECGGLVRLPCLACRVRQFAALTQRRFAPLSEEPIRLELHDEHRQRYERIRSCRRTPTADDSWSLNESGTEEEY